MVTGKIECKWQPIRSWAGEDESQIAVFQCSSRLSEISPLLSLFLVNRHLAIQTGFSAKPFDLGC